MYQHQTKKKPVYGVGINDAEYITYRCPYYVKWQSMLERVYSNKFSAYNGCSIVLEWHYFSKFKAWMEQQDWQGKELDKDILEIGNKIYGPDTCVFISKKINCLLNTRAGARGRYPIGVSANGNRYQASMRIEGKRVSLGSYPTVEAAEARYREAKSSHVADVATAQEDSRIRWGLYRNAFQIGFEV